MKGNQKEKKRMTRIEGNEKKRQPSAKLIMVIKLYKYGMVLMKKHHPSLVLYSKFVLFLT